MAHSSSDGRRRVHNPLSLLIGYSALSVAYRGLPILLLPVYVRYISPEEFGTFAAVTLLATIIAVGANLKLDAAMRTFYFDFAGDPARLREYLRQAVSLSLYAGCAIYVVTLPLGNKLFDFVFAHETIRFYPAGAVALASAVLNAGFSTYIVYLRNDLQLSALIRWQVSIIVGTVVCQSVLVMFFGFGIHGILWGYLLPLLLMLLFLAISRRDLFVTAPDWRLLGPSLRYAGPLILLGMLYGFGTRLDRFVLEHYVDLDTFGAYVVLISLLRILILTMNAVDNAIRPFLYPDLGSKAGVGVRSVDQYSRAYLTMGLLSLSMAIFLGSILNVFTDNVVYLSIQSWLVLGATAFVPLILTQFVALIYDFNKRSIDLTIWAIARFALLLVLLIGLTPARGVEGALLAILISETSMMLVLSLRGARLFAVRIPLARMLTQVVLFLSIIWSLGLGFGIGTGNYAAFGVTQLIFVATGFLALNGKDLRLIFSPRQAC